MRWAFHSRSADRTPLRRRATSLALTIAAHLLILLMLLRLAPSETPPPPQRVRPPAIFALLPDRQPDRTAAPKAAPKAAHHAASAAPKRVANTLPHPHPPLPNTTPAPSALIPLSLADSDISKITAPPAASADSGTGKDSGTAYGPGAGPGGERLYNADWYRRPTNAELAYYLPKDGPPQGWGEIACHMASDYHVENCREWGESPAGSGLARALRQASWQFRVLPPRLGSKLLPNGWVLIHIDFSDRSLK